MSEGGIGWVNMLADRVDYVLDHSASGVDGGHWTDDRRPSEVLAESFWFCSIDDPSTLGGVLERFGPDHVMLEVDYPHADSTWPDTQDARPRRASATSPADVIAKLTHENAEELFRWPPTLIRGGLVVDGTGAPGEVRDVGIRDGRIVPTDELGRRPGGRSTPPASWSPPASSTSTPTTTPSSSGTRPPARRRCTASPR